MPSGSPPRPWYYRVWCVLVRLPASLAKELVLYLLQRLRKPRLQERAGTFPQSLLSAPAIHLLRTAVPEGDRAVHGAAHNGVVSQVEQLRLLTQGLRMPLQFLLGLLTLGDVHRNADDAYQVVLLIMHGRVGNHRREGGAVPTPHHEFA